MERRALNLPVVLLICAMAAVAGLLLILAADLTFFGDSWETLMNRRDFTADALFAPHNEHLVALPVLITQIVLRVFGMSSPMPEFVILAAGLLATAALLFVYVRRRIGPWPALFAAVLLLAFGPAFEVLLWSYEIGFVGAICFGLASLLALEREDGRGDLLAVIFLSLSLGFSTLGVSFILGAAVAIALGPRQRWLRRAYVVAIPAALFVAWYLGWGHDAESHLSLKNVLAAPRFVAEEVAVGVGGLFGLGTSPTTGSPDPVWGRAILVALVVGIGVLVHRRLRKPEPGLPFPGLWPVAAAAAANWFLTAFNAFPGRDPAASRYQYATAVFVLAIAANLLRGVRFDRRALVIAIPLAALAIAPNLVVLKNGRDFFYGQTVITRADTAALEIARETVSPDFQLNPEVAGAPTLIDIFAGEYFTATDEYGSPAYSVSELESAPEAGRHQADVVLATALPIAKSTEPGSLGSTAGCATQPAGPKQEVAVGPGTTRIEVSPGPAASIDLRRFAAGEYPVQTEGAPGGTVTELTIPADRATNPWYLLVEAEQQIRICPPGG